jgi:hypothetical protein
MYPNPNNWNIIYLKINTKWGLPKEDFLHFIATGSAQMGRKGKRRDKCASKRILILYLELRKNKK